MVALTPEIRTALEFFRATGVRFHRTEERKLDCGCVLVAGWDTEKLEPAGGIIVCSEAHRPLAGLAMSRWGDADVVERFRDVPATEALEALLAEEIANDNREGT